jgi:hypothetical protein
VAEAETNGVIERLFRTLKEQIIHGRVFRTIDEVREAVRDFAALAMPNGWSRRTATAAPSTPAPHASTPTSGAPQSATACPGNRVRYRKSSGCSGGEDLGGIGGLQRGDAPTESRRSAAINRAGILQGFRPLRTGTLQRRILAETKSQGVPWRPGFFTGDALLCRPGDHSPGGMTQAK